MAMDRPSLHQPPHATAFPVFIDSSLGTNLAMSVSPDDTVADLKRKIRIEHTLCFPDVGEVSVQALKVKRRGAFYHLSNAMLVRSAFDGSKATWFLHVDIVATSISKFRGGTAEHFENQTMEQLDDSHQILVDPSRNLDEDMLPGRKDISVDDMSNVNEKQAELVGHVDLSKQKPRSCQIECLMNTSCDQFATHNRNVEQSTRVHQLERPEIDIENQVHESDGRVKEATKMSAIPNSGLSFDQANKEGRENKVPELGDFDGESVPVGMEGKSTKRNDVEQNDHFINANSEHVLSGNKMGKQRKANSVEEHTSTYNVGGALSGKETSTMGKLPSEVDTVAGKANLVSPEELYSKLRDGDPNLIEHRTDDKKKSKKRRHSSKSQQTEAASDMQSNDPDMALPQNTKEPYVEHVPLLGKNSSGLGPEVKEGNHVGALVNKHKDLNKQFDAATKQASENAAGGDSLQVDTYSQKIGVLDFSSENMAKGSHINHVSDMDFCKNIVEADTHEVALDDNHKDDITESNFAPSTKEAAPFRNSAEVESQIPTDVRRKKRSRKNLPKTLSGSNDPSHSLECAGEGNPKEQHGDHRGMDKESHTRTSNHEDTAKLYSENPSAGNVGTPHRKRRRKSEKVELTNFQANNYEPVSSLDNVANKQHSKGKLDGQEPQQLVVTTEIKSLPNTAVMDPTCPSIPDDTKSQRKKKRSAKVELQDHESTQQNFAHALVGEVAEEKAKKTLNNHDKELGKESNSLANNGEATVLGGSTKVDTAICSISEGKSTHRRKRKSGKLYSSHDTSGSQITEVNFEKTSTIISRYPGGASDDVILPNKTEQNASHDNGLNVHSTGSFNNLSNKCEFSCNLAKTDNEENLKGALVSTSANLVKEFPLHIAHRNSDKAIEANESRELPDFDNDKINFVDAFCPSIVQHESVVSAHVSTPVDTEPKKQHKSKKKRKSNKHDSACDLVYPSEMDKHHMVNSGQLICDSGNQDLSDQIGQPSSKGFSNGKAHDDAAKRMTNCDVNAGAATSDFMPPTRLHDSNVEEKIQGNKPDTFRLSSHDEQSKHVYNSKEKASSSKAAAKSPDHHHANASVDLGNETCQPEKNVIVNVGAHAVQSPSKTSRVSHKETLADPVASSDSTEEDTPVQAKQYRLAVRKVPSKNFGEFSSSNKQESSLFTPGAIFNAATSDSSEDEFEFRNREVTELGAFDSSASSSDSDGDLENRKISGPKSAAYGSKDEGSDGDITLSQSLSVSRKGMPLGTILRSSSSYKKAKFLASQSQAEDSESQPVDVVPETQPESD
ncbi:hypothetical protein C4D60_Mb06t29140 [Musa balbisiana]|uniref:Uncharacterized protein n=1 Tax=Musa balbisiana TaxID=52838 RepID=A0A4S8ITZ7_MUSBA|nr:hypothetical protein C4D60_Mb06t29140 [Musa balbisiana]